MTTATANIIQELEAVADPAEQHAILFENVLDSIFPQFIQAVYDPFQVYRVIINPTLQPILDPDAVNAALAEEWAYWLETLQGVTDGLTEIRPDSSWTKSPAWPVYQRCLWKRLEGVSDATVRGVWDDLPEFKAGAIGRTRRPKAWPVFVEPLYQGGRGGGRRIVIVRKPFSDDQCIIDVYDARGRLAQFPYFMAEQLRNFHYDCWLDEALPYEYGAVLDGVVVPGVGSAMATYRVFDVLPLLHFSEGCSLEHYESRRGMLSVLRELVVPGESLFTPSIATQCNNAALLDRVVRQLGANKCVVKERYGSYPFAESGAWFYGDTVSQDEDNA